MHVLAAFVCALLPSSPVLPARSVARSPLAPAMPRRAALLAATAFCAATTIGPARADEDCMTQCLRECKALVPGNDGYCVENCKSACAVISAKVGEAELESKPSGVASVSADDDGPVPVGSDSVGIFGRASDSGVERFAATLFGATKQAANVRVADREGFVNDIFSSFNSGVLKK
ncbi:hypothetical protein T492DRAFT_1083280 [Pavlovales sp. CCMP2436]|nr:hypothetical protein T492DRAFT_1083280 [Pavlovales sp. CCMP2436]